MKLNQIALQNFRAFHSFEDKLKFDNKSVLIYGENGSGKSSFFWALHAFVNYYKDEDKSKAYFSRGDDKSLLNLFNTQEDGFIKITFDDEVEYIYNQSGLTAGIQTQLTNLSRVKSFLTYKDLLGLDIMHSYENEIFAKKILLELLTGDISLTNSTGTTLDTQERLERMELLLSYFNEITYFKNLEDFKNQLFGDIENLEFLYSSEVGEFYREDKEGDIKAIEFNAISPDSFDELKALGQRVKSFIAHYNILFKNETVYQEFIDNWEGSLKEIEEYVYDSDTLNEKAEIYQYIDPEGGDISISTYIDNIETTLDDIEENVLDANFTTKFNEIFISTDTSEKLYNDWKIVKDTINIKINLMNTGVNKINTLLEKLGYDNIDVAISIDYDKKKILDFNVKFNDKQLEHYKFLNEAKLSAINLAFYFSAILSYTKPDIPILVLDDLLISLDMGNRAKVLELITDQDLFENYQLFIMTHDRFFFEMAKHKFDYIQKGKWSYYEMYIDNSSDINKPFVTTSLSYLEKANKYLQQNEYEIAGNLLRKEAESFCKYFLPKKYQFKKDCSLYDLNGLIANSLVYAYSAGLDLTLFTKLDSYRKFILNSTSHDSYSVPKYKKELISCFKVLTELRNIKIKPFLKRGDVLEFILVASKGDDTYKIEVILEDDFKVMQLKNNTPVISKGLINYVVYKNGKKTKSELQHKNTTLKKFYADWYKKSNKVENENFWKVIKIQKDGAIILKILDSSLEY